MKVSTSSPNNFFLLLKLAYKTFQANTPYGSYHHLVRREARETIQVSFTINDGSVPTKIFKKIQWYMVSAVYLGEILANLTDHVLTKRETKTFIYLGSVMALFDIIVDDYNFEKHVVAGFFEKALSGEKNVSTGRESAIEKIFQLYLQKLIGLIEEKKWPAIKKQFDLIQYQLRSQDQRVESISEENVIKITFGKGGAAILLCASLLQASEPPFQKAMYELGGLIQMMNDCQDIYKDTKEEIVTFVHFKKNFSEILKALDLQRAIALSELQSLPCSFDGRYKTAFIFNAIFVAISYKLHRYAKVCNHQLDFKKIKKMNKEDFRINPFSLGAVRHCLIKILRFSMK
jgi:hypothetical protein